MRAIILVLVLVLACHPASASRQFQALTDTLVGGSVALPSTGSVSIMVYPQFAGDDGLYHILFEVANPGTTTYFQVLKGSQGALYTAWVDGTSTVVASAAPGTFTLPQNVWSNIVVTWVSGGSLTLYLNGAQIATASGTPWFSTAGLPWSFGNRSSGGYPWAGRIALFGLWSHILGPSEIATLVLGKPPSTIPNGLLAEYDLAGSSIAAQAGSGGTLVGSGPVAGADIPPPPAPTLSMAGPSKGTKGLAVVFTLGESHLANPTVVTLSDGGAGGALSPSKATLTAGNPFASFIYTPAAGGSVVISMANDQGIPNPPPLILQVVTIQSTPTLSVDATQKSVAQGSDVSYAITQTIPLGFTGDTPALRLFNVPSGFNLIVNGVDCGLAWAAISYFNWSNCGPSPGGTYTLTVHSGSLRPGVYFFGAAEGGRQISNGSGLTLTLTVN
jgi:hypothetical protein